MHTVDNITLHNTPEHDTNNVDGEKLDMEVIDMKARKRGGNVRPPEFENGITIFPLRTNKLLDSLVSEFIKLIYYSVLDDDPISPDRIVDLLEQITPTKRYTKQGVARALGISDKRLYTHLNGLGFKDDYTLMLQQKAAVKNALRKVDEKNRLKEARKRSR